MMMTSEIRAFLFDMSELDGDDPITLDEFMAVNCELHFLLADGSIPDDDIELIELASCAVGGKVNLGIGGGFVTMTRSA